MRSTQNQGTYEHSKDSIETSSTESTIKGNNIIINVYILMMTVVFTDPQFACGTEEQSIGNGLCDKGTFLIVIYH